MKMNERSEKEGERTCLIGKVAEIAKTQRENETGPVWKQTFCAWKIEVVTTKFWVYVQNERIMDEMVDTVTGSDTLVMTATHSSAPAHAPAPSASSAPAPSATVQIQKRKPIYPHPAPNTIILSRKTHPAAAVRRALNILQETNRHGNTKKHVSTSTNQKDTKVITVEIKGMGPIIEKAVHVANKIKEAGRGKYVILNIETGTITCVDDVIKTQQTSEVESARYNEGLAEGEMDMVPSIEGNTLTSSDNKDARKQIEEGIIAQKNSKPTINGGEEAIVIEVC